MDEKQIIKALSKVNDPDLKKDLVSLNMIKNISIDNNVVSFEIVLTTPACPLKEQIKKDCLNELNKINNNLKYNIIFSSNVVPFDKKTMIKNIKNIIAISSGKGGVGKSTIASNLAVGLGNMGAKTGLIDADIFGPSIPTMFNCENEQPTIKKSKEKNIIIPIEQYGIKLLSMGLLIPNNKAVVWRGPMASSAMKQLILDVEWGELDYLIVDLPPGTSDIHITLSQSFPVTGTVIISTPQKVSTNDAEKAISMYNQEQTNIPIIGLIENMSYFIDDNDKKNYLFGKDGGKTLCNKFSIDFIGQIPIDKRISDGSDLGYPIILKENKISDIFKTLSQNIARKIAINNSK
jgi:ATP-binding protein involved in chromosome partitioning